MPDPCWSSSSGRLCAAFTSPYNAHRLGESRVDAFTIMRIAGHSSIVVSQRYIHSTPEAVEKAFARLQESEAISI